jgi:biopolymer transport protein ExbD
MASIDTSQGSEKGKIKKKTISIDMTPMVDLGFLLLTFFILTATVNSPVAMDMKVPKDNKVEQQTELNDKAVLNIILNKESAYLYEGIDLKTMEAVSFKQIRKKINEKKTWCKQNGLEKEFTLLIKADKNAFYQQIVDMLDEMVISDVKSYTLLDVLPVEEQYIKQNLMR